MDRLDMMVLLGQLAVCLLALDILLAPDVDAQSQMDQGLLPCPDVEHVCGSLMKVQHKRAHEEGNYCTCDGCLNDTWNENDDRAFTWFHHEKRHWMVQYRFCESVMPRQLCRHREEVGAVIRTDAQGWNPRIRKLDCRCPDNRYYLQGWTLVDSRYWDYHYVCDRKRCPKPGALEPRGSAHACVKRYMDALGEKTMGYRFLCSCPDGLSCPIHFEDGDTPAIEGTDNQGPYIQGYCIEGGGKQPKPVIQS